MSCASASLPVNEGRARRPCEACSSPRLGSLRVDRAGDLPQPVPNNRGSFVMIPSTPIAVSFSILRASSTVHT